MIKKPSISLHQRNKRRKIYCKITKPQLADLFSVPESTITSWIQHKKFDPSNLKDIILKFNNRFLLDKRKKQPSQPQN